MTRSTPPTPSAGNAAQRSLSDISALAQRRSAFGLRRFFRRAGVIVVILAAFLLVSTGTNAALEQIERSQLSYGERVTVGEGALNVYRHGKTGPTLVMVSGYGTPSPVTDFGPLIRELDGYQVVVVEGFGYGLSDLEAPPRTVENIATELHTALGEAGVEEPYVLLGHSIAGLYTLYYANQYPDEVRAVVGIDASVPGQMNGLAEAGNPFDRVIATAGLLRIATSVVPALVEPEGDAFTPAEREQIRLITNWNYGNSAVADEAVHGAHNFATVRDLTYPSNLPVLAFIKQRNNQPRWKELHESQLRNLDRGELVELDGGHYLHWTHSPQIADKVTEFLGTPNR
jgi:pimeloyl-ACP methyl ester carboxylesterase